MLAFTHKTCNSCIDQAKSLAVDQPRCRGVGAGDDQTEGNANDGEDDGRQVQACLDASVERQRGGKDNDESEGYVDEADGKAPFYYSDCSFVLMGRMTVKVLPLVPSLSAETLPPNKSSICFTCARPRPLPSFLWAVSAW